MKTDDFKHSLRRYVYNVLQNPNFEDKTTRWVNYVLIALIVLNILVVLLESVNSLFISHQLLFTHLEYFFLTIFTIEFLLRIWSVPEENLSSSPVEQRKKWLFSADGWIDIITLVPAYINFFVPIDLGMLRLLRLLRLLKLTRHFNALQLILNVIKNEKNALQAVVFILLILIVLAAGGMYVVEHHAQPQHFGSIPQAMWWAVVTLTTVGYGDVTPVTVGGKIFGAIMTVLGVGLAALPAGILATGLAQQLRLQNHQAVQTFRALAHQHQLDLDSNPDKIELLRQQAGLDKEKMHDILLELMRARYIKHQQQPYAYCPHCGHALPNCSDMPNDKKIFD